MSKKKQKYVCKICGAELRWYSKEELSGRVYPDDGTLGKSNVDHCEIAVECSKTEEHDCGFECDDFERVAETTKTA